MSNADKLAAAKAWLGERWLLHPANAVQKKAQVTRPEVVPQSVRERNGR